MRALNLSVVPVTQIGDQIVVGFNRPALGKALGLDGSSGVQQGAEWMARKFETVISAAIRATNQIPDHLLDWKTPDRDRSLRQFTFHIFDRPNIMLDAYEQSGYRAEAAGRYVTEALTHRDTAHIAAFGEGVLARIRKFMASASFEILQEPVDTYMGPMSLQQLMDLGLGHSVHHLKQLYFYMELIDLVPEDPLTKQDFDGVEVPTELF